MRRRSLLSATNKRDGYITTYATANTLTYTGNSQLLVTAAVGSGTILYSLDNTNFSSTIPTAINAGSYTVYYKAEESRFFLQSSVYNVLCNISRAPGYISTEPTPKSLTYTGSALTLLNAGAGTGTMVYSLDNTNFSSTIPTGTNHNTYRVYYKVNQSSNFTESSVYYKDVTINKAAGSISYGTTSVTKTYGNSAFTNTLTKTGDGSVTYSSSNTSVATINSNGLVTILNAGSATITATVTDGSNYSYSTKTATYSLTINPKAVSATVTLSQTSYPYSGSACQPTPTVKDGSTVIPSSEYTISYSNNVNAGTATCTISDKANGNYTVSGSATFTINKASLSSVTITLSWTSKPYNGSAQVPTATVKSGNTTLTSGTHYSLSYTNSSSKNTGTYTITASPTSNYSFTNASASYSITKINPTIVTPTGKTGLVYNRSELVIVNAGTYTTPGRFEYGFTYGGDLAFTTNLPKQVAAGTSSYDWKFYPTDTTNYNIMSGTISPTPSIGKATPVIATSPTKRSNWTYNGTTYDLLLGGSMKHSSSDSTAVAGSFSYLRVANAGTYTNPTWSFTPTDSWNYNSTSGYVSGTVTVSKANPSDPVSGRGLSYNRSSQNLVTLNYTPPGTMHYKVGSGSWVTSIPTSVNAGTYTVYYYMEASTNYNAYGTSSSPGSKSTTISKITPVLSSNPTYVSNWTYDGASHNVLTGGAMKFSSSDTTAVAGTFTYDTAKDAGTYSNKYWYFTPTDTTNYNSTYAAVSGSVTVNKATLSNVTITLNWASNYYNGSVLVPSVTVKSNGTTLTSGTHYSLSYSNSSSKNAGSYTITASATPNYSFTAVSGTYKILPINPTIVAPTGKSNLTYTGSALTLLNPGSCTTNGTFYYNISGGSYSTSIPTATNANTAGYSVGWKFTPGDSTNFNEKSGTITVPIAKKSITITVSLTGWTFGNTANNPSVSGNSSGGSVTYSYKVNGAADTTYTTTKPSSANTYVIRAVVAETTNYLGGTATNTFTISKANSAISFSGNGTVREDYTMTKAASRTRGDGTITYSSNNTSKATVNNNGTVTGVSPGSCTITVTTSATTNYNAASASYTLTVQQGYVDLGLSSGIRWAKRNIGAGAISDVGLYYAWGDPTGHSAGSGYNWGSGNDTQPYVNLTGGVRSLTTDLIDSQDMAYRNWADEWRMPTKTQWNELVTGTNVTFTTMDGVSGMKCTNKSNSSKYIFIPCGGWLKNACANLGSDKGRYWLRSVGGTPAEQGSSGYFVPSETRATTANAAKYLGCPVRAIYNPTAA